VRAVRGGALPLLGWACLIGALFAMNWIWTGDETQIKIYGSAVGIVAFAGLLMVLASREAIRRGPPPKREGARARLIPDVSAGAVGAALGVAAAVFGLAFGHFMIYFGCGLLVLSLGRLAIERRAECATRKRHPSDPRAAQLQDAHRVPQAHPTQEREPRA
jgi:uncharacterized membrane protein YfcA